MIARLLSTAKELLHRERELALLTKPWSGSETVGEMQSRILQSDSSLTPMQLGIVNSFFEYKGVKEDTRLNQLISSSTVEISGFSKEVKKWGYREKDVLEAISSWIAQAERLKFERAGPSLSDDEEPQAPKKKKAGVKKSNKIQSNNDLEGDESFEREDSVDLDEEALRNEAKASLDNYKIEVSEESEGMTHETGEEILVHEGFHGYAPANVNNSFNNGYLYYPVQTVIAKVEKIKGEERLAEKIETVVIRSDRTMQRIIKSERLKEGDVGHDVLRLTDGTLIHTTPKPNNHGTWSWRYIEAFLSKDSKAPPIEECLYMIHDHLRSRIWLPFDADYWLLATTAVATYVQSIFDSVPLLLLVGPAGSGKSELGTAMSEVSANATMIGQVSAPTMMRLIDESGGLCIIDDLESVGVNGKNGQKKFSDIAQVLKVSYKKSTATRMVTNPTTRKTEVMNFFGIKIVSNTKGVDDILGSRMLQIHTRYIEPDDLQGFQERNRLDDEDLDYLRNILHTWAFENTDTVYKTYLSMSQKQGDRESEIALPLRVIAKMSNDENIIVGLETALAAQKRRRNRHANPSEMLKEVLDRLIKQGYRSASITHLMLEMRKEMDPGYDINYSEVMPGWSKQEWIGRKLREMDVAKEKSFRRRVKGKNLRFIDFKERYIKAVLARSGKSQPKTKAPESFCNECSTCSFKHHQCEIAIENL